MSGRNVIALDPNRRARRAFPEEGVIATLIFLIFDAMLFAGMVGIFMLTRTAAGGAWPPTEQPWFSPGAAIVNTTALLASGALVFRAAGAWEKREARIGPLIFAAIVLGAFFVFFQGVAWVSLIGQGLTLTSSQHGNFFCLIVGFHSAQVVGALIFLGVVWRRLKPLRDGEEARASLSTTTFSTARFFWYFVVGVWPILYFLLY